MSELMQEEIKYEGPRFSVTQKIFRREDGKTYIRDIVNPGDAAVILPVNEKNEVVFIKQLREAIGEVSLELPAGMVDPGEAPQQTAVRELAEETGIRAKTVEHLITVYSSSGYTSEKVHIYIAKDFAYGEQHLDDMEEILGIETIPIERCLALAKENYFKNASQNIAILLYYFKYMDGGANG